MRRDQTAPQQGPWIRQIKCQDCALWANFEAPVQRRTRCTILYIQRCTVHTQATSALHLGNRHQCDQRQPLPSASDSVDSDPPTGCGIPNAAQLDDNERGGLGRHEFPIAIDASIDHGSAATTLGRFSTIVRRVRCRGRRKSEWRGHSSATPDTRGNCKDQAL